MFLPYFVLGILFFYLLQDVIADYMMRSPAAGSSADGDMDDPDDEADEDRQDYESFQKWLDSSLVPPAGSATSSGSTGNAQPVTAASAPAAASTAAPAMVPPATAPEKEAIPTTAPSPTAPPPKACELCKKIPGECH